MNYYFVRRELLERYKDKENKNGEHSERAIHSRPRRYNSEPAEGSGNGYHRICVTSDQTNQKAVPCNGTTHRKVHRYNSEPVQGTGNGCVLTKTTSGDLNNDVSEAFASDDDTDQTFKKEVYPAGEPAHHPARHTISEPSKGTGNGYRLTDGTSGVSSRDVSPSARDQTFKKEVYPAGVSAHYPARRTNSEPSKGTGNGYRLTDGTSGDSSRDVSPSARGQNQYDFYLAVSEEDMEDFGYPFCRLVETRMCMRPCLTSRDIGAGYLLENMAETLETKCGGKVVFVVSKNFAGSDECKFLVQFAKTLDPDAISSKLIPLVIDKNVTLPRVLEGLSCIHYNVAMRERWLADRLWEAVHGPRHSSPLRSLSCP